MKGCKIIPINPFWNDEKILKLIRQLNGFFLIGGKTNVY